LEINGIFVFFDFLKNVFFLFQIAESPNYVMFVDYETEIEL